MPQPVGPVTISWNASPEPEVIGYFLYVGRGHLNYNDARSPVDVPGGGTTSVVFNVDAPGYWFFNVAAYTATQTSGWDPLGEISDFFGTLGLPNFSGRNTALRGFVVA